MSSSQVVDWVGNGKIYTDLLPNPYPFPAEANPLSQVLIAGQDAGNQDIINLNEIQVTNVTMQVAPGILNPHLSIGGAGNTLRVLGATDKGSIIVGNGTDTKELVCPTTTTTSTTSTIYNWNALANGQSRTFNVSNGSLYQLGYSITITYSGTDSITGTITAVVGNLVTLTITSFASAVYVPATLITTTGPDPVTATSGGGDPVFIFNPAVSTPATIPANSFLTTGLCYLYSAPAQPAQSITLTALSIGAVNPTTSAFTIPVYENPPVSTTAFSWGAEGCFLPLGSPELAAGTGGNIIAFAFPTGGSFIAQNFTGSVSGYTLAYTPNGAITINSKLVLTADSTKPLGVFWGVDAQGVGTITSVSAGTNISVSGSLSAPVVNLASPLTSTLGMGLVALTDKNGASGTAGQFLSAGTGGETEWATPPDTLPTLTAGNNIDITGTQANPTIDLQSPLTADLFLGSVNMTAGDPVTQTHSITNNGGASYTSATNVGGQVLATYGATSMEIRDPSIQKNINITPATGIFLNDQSVGTSIVDNTITETQVQLSSVNGITSSLTQATITNQALQYVNTDSTITPTFTSTSTYDNCSRTAVSLNDTTGATATRTEIIDNALQSRQQQTLVSPSANTTSTINCNCEIITSVPTAYFQLLTDNSNTLVSTAFGATASDLQGEMSASYTNTTLGSEYQGTGNILCNGGASQMMLTSANIAGASSHLLRLECPLVGDALIEHSVVGASVRNLDVTTPGQFSVACGTSGFSIASPAGATQTGIAGNSAGSLIASGVNHIFRTTSATSTAATPTYLFQSEAASTASYPAIKLDRPVPASGTQETIGTIAMWADDASNVTREYVRLQAKTENVSPGNVDGTLSVLTIINSGATPTEIFNFNGGQNEINTFRPFDLNGNALRTSQGDMTITTTASAGTGLLTISAKADVDITGTSCAVQSVSGANTGALYTNPGSVELEATNTLTFTGAGLQSPTAGGSAGTHLVITLNGTQYKIALLNP